MSTYLPFSRVVCWNDTIFAFDGDIDSTIFIGSGLKKKT